MSSATKAKEHSLEGVALQLQERTNARIQDLEKQHTKNLNWLERRVESAKYVPLCLPRCLLTALHLMP